MENDIELLGSWKRTHGCGALRIEHVGQEAVLMGWVNTRRDLGNLIFVDLRDRTGIVQVVFDPQIAPECHNKARVLRNEWVLAVKGEVTPRLKGQENPDLPTGAIELKAKEVKILNRTEPPPFQVDGAVDGSETLRLKYRYLELRRPEVFRLFQTRHRIAASVRKFLDVQGFVEVETPFLTKSTPEGARDYLVPSRVNKGKFYALPQSPQLFKQLLMIGGFDRYYQIVRCFRDEDLRADRQPEFTQVDLEMSFVTEEDVIGVHEDMMAYVFGEVLDHELATPFPRLTYKEAMEKFGTDRPDLRFGLEIVDISEICARSDFNVFKTTVKEGGAVKAINVKTAASSFSRKALDELAQVAIDQGAKGLLYIKVETRGWKSSIEKFFPESIKLELNKALNAEDGDLLLLLADQPQRACSILGEIRLLVAKKLQLIDESRFLFLWITEFPLLEYNEEEARFEAVHHPFTSPMEEDIPLLDSSPHKVRARAYDLVLNGAEIGGGSIRIHLLDLQKKMFSVLGISPEQAERKFGFFLEALRYGAPPHGGMAVGFDRLVSIMTGAQSIREVIAFPKTTSATCPLTDAPSEVSEAQLKELGLQLSLERDN
ncbi:MAG: aspartate--tRNA ligase [Deltaproteobacteria bacterium]|nr:MAG: aspartate--tRNA ligase [Deltaproteobacteria bacterium]